MPDLLDPLYVSRWLAGIREGREAVVAVRELARDPLATLSLGGRALLEREASALEHSLGALEAELGVGSN